MRRTHIRRRRDASRARLVFVFRRETRRGVDHRVPALRIAFQFFLTRIVGRVVSSLKPLRFGPSRTARLRYFRKTKIRAVRDSMFRPPLCDGFSGIWAPAGDDPVLWVGES